MISVISNSTGLFYNKHQSNTTQRLNALYHDKI